MNRLKFLWTLRQLLVGVLAGLVVSLLWWLVSLGFLRDLGFLEGSGFLEASLGFIAGLAALGAALVGYLMAQENTQLLLPPGARLREVLRFIYSPKISERIFDQIIADMQHE